MIRMKKAVNKIYDKTVNGGAKWYPFADDFITRMDGCMLWINKDELKIDGHTIQFHEVKLIYDHLVEEEKRINKYIEDRKDKWIGGFLND